MNNNFRLEDEFTITHHKGMTIITAKNEEEERQLTNDINKTIVHKVKRLKQPLTVVGEQNIKSRDTRPTLKQGYDLYIKFLNAKSSDKEAVKKVANNANVIFYFLDENIKIHNISKEDIKKIQIGLTKMPSGIRNITFFKNKNIKELIKKDSAILDKYKKNSIRTIDNYIRRFKTMFFFFIESGYIINNVIDGITYLGKKNGTTKKSFKDFELNAVLTSLDDINHNERLKVKRFEERNLLIFNLFTACRLSETLNIKIEDISLKSRMIQITLEDTEKKKHKRRIAIHSDVVNVIKEQAKNKSKEDYLFFNHKKEKNKSKNTSNTINNQIKRFLPTASDKSTLNIHSLRRNFIQNCYANNIEDVKIKMFVGHTLEDNITYSTYNDNKMSDTQLIEIVDKLSFDNFETITKYKVNRVKNAKSFTPLDL